MLFFLSRFYNYSNNFSTFESKIIIINLIEIQLNVFFFTNKKLYFMITIKLTFYDNNKTKWC